MEKLKELIEERSELYTRTTKLTEQIRKLEQVDNFLKLHSYDKAFDVRELPEFEHIDYFMINRPVEEGGDPWFTILTSDGWIDTDYMNKNDNPYIDFLSRPDISKYVISDFLDIAKERLVGKYFTFYDRELGRGVCFRVDKFFIDDTIDYDNILWTGLYVSDNSIMKLEGDYTLEIENVQEISKSEFDKYYNNTMKVLV